MAGSGTTAATTTTLTEPIASNYYPINSALTVADGRLMATLTPDRAVGGTSLASGELELLLHRRLIGADYPGMENLNETQGAVYDDDNDTAFEPIRRLGPGIVVRARHWLSFGTPSEAPRAYRRAQENAYGGLVTRFSTGGNAHPGQVGSGTSMTPLRQPLPEAVSLLSLEALENGTVLLRLAHKYGVAEGGQAINVSLGQLFSPTFITVGKVDELSLSATRPKSEIRRLHWDTEGVPAGTAGPPTSGGGGGGGGVGPSPDSRFEVELGPLEIRTFALTPAAAEHFGS